MSYIESTKLPNEEVTYRTHLHWVIFIRPVLWFIVTFLLGVFLLTTNYSDNRFAALGIDAITIIKLLPLIAFIIGLVDFIAQYIGYISSEFGVTNKRVIVKIGYIRRSTSENFLSKIENIQVSQTILGRILNYGTIIIHGTGGTREPFFLIDDPLEFRKQIQIQVEKSLVKTKDA
jgi:uncharacterized membrane protein YdbT with pleckstrin-like domain